MLYVTLVLLILGVARAVVATSYCTNGKSKLYMTKGCSEYQVEFNGRKCPVRHVPADKLIDESTCSLTHKSKAFCQEFFTYYIKTTWDGQLITDHKPIKISFAATPSRRFVKMKVESPLFPGTPPPLEPPGPTLKLWEHEVVEAFFLNSETEAYLEVELSPYGNHLVLLLKGYRNTLNLLLPLEYTASISPDGGSWTGVADIPVDYFPPNVDKFNAFAAHGVDPDVSYEKLFPQKPPITQPDFHRLQDFEPIDMQRLIPDNESREYSQIWKDSIESANDGK